jgi:putative beta barrel porin BBP7
MRIGSFARSQFEFTALYIAAAVTAALPLATFGQSHNAYARNGAAPNRTMQALYMSPADAGDTGSPRYVDAHGRPRIQQAGYYQPSAEVTEGGPQYQGNAQNGSGQQYGGSGQYEGSGQYQGGAQYEGGAPSDGSGPYGECGPDGGGGPYYGGDPYGGGGPMAQGGFMGPFPMGAGGTDPPIGYDLMNDVGIQGDLVDQRGPHYFDLRAEAVFLNRDVTFGPNIIFTKEDVFPNGVTRLTSNQLDYGTTPGFRVVGRYDILPLSVVEFGYTGVFNFNSSATFRDPDEGTQGFVPDLYSLWSGFGNDAVFPNVTQPGGPGPFTERALQHSISIESDLQSAEISYRRYWLGWIPRVSGTWLAGFRYTRLNEEFEFESIGGETVPYTNPSDPTLPIAEFDYAVDADNNLAGFQAGGDIWVCLTQGLRFGTEGKLGVYNNHYVLTSKAVTTPFSPLPPSLFERERENQPAFIGELSIDLVADVLPSVSIRVGYELLVINSVVLAGENFNTGSPYNPGPLDNGLGPLREEFVKDQSEVVYQGGHIGIEYIW